MKKRAREISKNSHYSLLITLAILFILGLAVSLYDKNNNQLTSLPVRYGDNIKQGYGVPWNLFSSQHENLLDSSNNIITAKADYIYKYGYVWDHNSNQWKRFEFPQPKVSNNWVAREASFDLTSLNLPSGKYGFVAYTCQYANNQWKCGCRTSQCRRGVDGGMWQLQEVMVTGGFSLGPNTQIPNSNNGFSDVGFLEGGLASRGGSVRISPIYFRGGTYPATIYAQGVSTLEGMHYKALSCDATANPSCEPNLVGDERILAGPDWRFFSGNISVFNAINVNMALARWMFMIGDNSPMGVDPTAGDHKIRFVLNGVESPLYYAKVIDNRSEIVPTAINFLIEPTPVIKGNEVTLTILASGIASDRGLEGAGYLSSACYAGSLSSSPSERNCYPLVGGGAEALRSPKWTFSKDPLFARARLTVTASDILGQGLSSIQEGYYNLLIEIYGVGSDVKTIEVRN